MAQRPMVLMDGDQIQPVLPIAASAATRRQMRLVKAD
jgi:hypothetical protein